MEWKRIRGGRRGVHLLVVVAALAALAGAAAMVGATRTRTSQDTLRRLRDDLRVRDLLASAVEEAGLEFMSGANDPGHPLYLRLRSGRGDMGATPAELLATRELFGSLGEQAAVEATVEVRDSAPLSAGFEEASEWEARLRIEARAVLPGGAERVLVRTRTLRSISIELPHPLDQACHYDGDLDPGDDQEPFPMDPGHWRNKAPLRVVSPEGGRAQDELESLLATLRGASGVLLVENRPDDPVRLQGRTMSGRLQIAVLGPLVVSDLAVEDPARDRIRLVAFGDVELSGEIEAAVLMTRVEGAAAPRRRVLAGTSVDGALVVTEGDYEAPRGLRLDCGEVPQRRGGAPAPESLWIAVAPVLEDAGGEVGP